MRHCFQEPFARCGFGFIRRAFCLFSSHHPPPPQISTFGWLKYSDTGSRKGKQISKYVSVFQISWQPTSLHSYCYFCMKYDISYSLLVFLFFNGIVSGFLSIFKKLLLLGLFFFLILQVWI